MYGVVRVGRVTKYQATYDFFGATKLQSTPLADNPRYTAETSDAYTVTQAYSMCYQVTNQYDALTMRSDWFFLVLVTARPI